VVDGGKPDVDSRDSDYWSAYSISFARWQRRCYVVDRTARTWHIRTTGRRFNRSCWTQTVDRTGQRISSCRRISCAASTIPDSRASWRSATDSTPTVHQRPTDNSETEIFHSLTYAYLLTYWITGTGHVTLPGPELVKIPRSPVSSR